MKVTMTFDLPAALEEFDLYQSAPKLLTVISEMDKFFQETLLDESLSDSEKEVYEQVVEFWDDLLDDYDLDFGE